MTVEGHLREAGSAGDRVLYILSPYGSNDSPDDAEHHATVAAHHALAAQVCRRCDGAKNVPCRWGYIACERCGGRGWKPRAAA